MKFNSHIKHKTKPKLLTLLLSLILAVSMIVPMNTLEVYATGTGQGGSGTGVDSGNLSDNKSSGMTYQNTGWLVYLSDTSGALRSEVVFVSAGGNMPPGNADASCLTSRIGTHEYDRIESGKAEWGYPFDNGGNGFGSKIKEEMLQNGTYSVGDGNSDYVVKKYLGDTALKLYQDEPANIYLNLEVVGWHNNYKHSNLGPVVASASGFATYNEKHGLGSNSVYRSFTNKRYQVSCMGDKDLEGLPPAPRNASGIISNADISSYTYGLITIWGAEKNPDAQSTCDEKQNGTPSKAPEESTGVYKIVKSYRIRNLDTNVLTDSGTYVKPDSSPNITIEDESIFKLVAWKTSTQFEPGIVSTKWESTVPAVHKQSGTTPTTIEMKAPETTLYLLLEKPENESTPVTGQADFVMSQSTITRKIKLSYPDNNGITIMKDTLFKWVRPAHKSSCSGHSYADGKDSEGHTKYSTAYCSYGKFTDNSVRFSLKNSEKSNYPDIVATKSGWENVTTTGLKEPLAKQAALMYNLLRKVDRTRVPICPL